MIVDDEKGIREALKQLLEYEEIKVQVCASGHEAIRVYLEPLLASVPRGGATHPQRSSSITQTTACATASSSGKLRCICASRGHVKRP